jgi:hypothetical protein
MATQWSETGAVKLSRASEIVRELHTEITAFHQSNPYKLIAEREASSGAHVVRVRILQTPPVRWGALIGDAIHNLRSALDLLIWQLVLHAGGTPGKRTAFPIFDRETDFLAGYAAQLAGTDASVGKRVKALAPYEKGNATLWLLHRLDIIDKHRVLLPAYSSVGTTIIDMSVGMRGVADWLKDIPPMPIGLNWATPSCPVRDGEELWRVPADSLDKVDLNPKFTFNIALAPGTPVKLGTPVLSMLKGFEEEVAKVVAAFPELS